MPSVLCSEQQMNSMKIRLYSTKLSFKFQYTLLKLLTTPHPTVHCNRATRNTSVFTFSTLTANDELHTHTTRQNRDAEVRDTRRRGATDRRLSTTAAATTGDAGWMPHTDVVVFAVLADALQTTLHYTAKRRTHTLLPRTFRRRGDNRTNRIQGERIKKIHTNTTLLRASPARRAMMTTNNQNCKRERENATTTPPTTTGRG